MMFLNKDKTPILDSHQLLTAVEKKDARFRVFQSLFFIMIAIFLVLLLILTYKVQNENNVLINDQNKILSEQRVATENLKNHIDCIVSLFGQPNRPNLVISNIDNCKITPTN